MEKEKNFFMKGILNLKEITEMDKEMEQEQNMIKMGRKKYQGVYLNNKIILYYLKESIQMEKEMEKEKNIIKMEY